MRDKLLADSNMNFRLAQQQKALGGPHVVLFIGAINAC